MTLLETPRSRTVVVATAIAVVAAFCFLFVLQVVQVRAAKRASRKTPASMPNLQVHPPHRTPAQPRY